MKTCRDLMTKVVITCNEDDIVTDVARLMKSGNVGSIPVVESQDTQKLVGIITDRDIVVRVVADGHHPNTIKVHSVMTTDVVSCFPEDSIESAMQKMKEHQVRRIPVVEQGWRIVGIIAQADIARHINNQATGEVVSEISEEALVEI